MPKILIFNKFYHVCNCYCFKFTLPHSLVPLNNTINPLEALHKKEKCSCHNANRNGISHCNPVILFSIIGLVCINGLYRLCLIMYSLICSSIVCNKACTYMNSYSDSDFCFPYFFFHIESIWGQWSFNNNIMLVNNM
jgi:hypothetical protein